MRQNMNIGEAIKFLRSKRNISQVDLAEKVEITQGFLSLIEQGEREPGFELVKKISRTLQVPEQLIFLLTCQKTPTQRRYTRSLNKIALALDDILQQVTTQA